MMYGNKLAVAVKHNGKVLREFNKDTVYLPFGAEYSIFIKNLDTVRASVSIEIDGQNIADGDTFVVNGSDSIDIERFLKRGNLSEGNRFRFIERSASVEQHRGVGAEDGIVVVKYKFEKRAPKVEYVDHHYVHHYYDWNHPWYRRGPYYGDVYCNSGSFGGDTKGVASNTLVGGTSGPLNAAPQNEVTSSEVKLKALRGQSVNTAYSANVASAQGTPTMDSFTTTSINDAGITVPGSLSEQQFKTAEWFATEDQEFSLVLRLLGQTEQQQVIEAITVKHKQKCTTCGHTNKANAKFCINCGTSLHIV